MHAKTSAAQEIIPEDFVSSVECVEPELNRSCRYTNIYFNHQRGWFLLMLKKGPTIRTEVHRSNKYADSWRPTVQVFSNRSSIKAYIEKQFNHLERRTGLTVYFHALFHENLGHALFDGLYPAFLALSKFGLRDEKFRALVWLDENCYPDKTFPLQPGALVKSYLPDASRKSGHSLSPEYAIVSQLPERHWTPQCEYVTDEDDRGIDLFSKILSPAEDLKAACCNECAKVQMCEVAILLGSQCFLKGSCPEGRGKCAYTRKEGQISCRLPPNSPKMQAVVRPLAPLFSQSLNEGTTEQASSWNSVQVTVPSAWILGPVRRRCPSEDIFRIFAGGGLIALYDFLRDLQHDIGTVVQFSDFVVGSGGMGNLVMDASGAVAGSLGPLQGTAAYRNRIMWSYGIYGEAGRAIVPARPADRIHAIFIHNRRYTAADMVEIKSAIGKLKDINGVTAEYIDWREVGGGKFVAHMRLLNRTDIYVSSPGTALMYVPFMWTGGVFVALGHRHELYGRKFPSFMEQQVAGGGTPYLRALYMDSRELMRDQGHGGFLSEKAVLDLGRQAVQLVREGFSTPVAVMDNLSIEGRIVMELCQADPATCKVMFSERNGYVKGKWQCVVDMWPECIVYEVGGYAEGGHNGESCSVNRVELRKLRKRYGLPGFGAPGV